MTWNPWNVSPRWIHQTCNINKCAYRNSMKLWCCVHIDIIKTFYLSVLLVHVPQNGKVYVWPWVKCLKKPKSSQIRKISEFSRSLWNEHICHQKAAMFVFKFPGSLGPWKPELLFSFCIVEISPHPWCTYLFITEPLRLWWHLIEQIMQCNVVYMLCYLEFELDFAFTFSNLLNK